MRRSFARLSLACALVSLVAAVQGTRILAGTTGDIQGIVSDSAGHFVAGAQVSAIAPSYATKTVTNPTGFYALNGLPPDTYQLTVAKSGFQTTVVPGITVTQDQVSRIDVKLQKEAKVIGQVSVRGATSLVQPTTTADVYTVSAATIQNITGTPQNISESAVLNSLPGITTDSFGYPIIRGGAENEEGYQLEGIDATDPITGQFINSLSLVGAARLVVSTGGYDVSSGNTNVGVINEVVKRGAYPGAGQATVTMNWPNFDHRFAFEYGNATTDNKLSYFFGFNGLRQFREYGDTKTFEPRLVGATGSSSGNEDVVNFFYRWGRNGENELQYFGETGANLFQHDYIVDARITPYASANQVVINQTGGLSAFSTFFPGQGALTQNIGYPDNENNIHILQKINYKRQFTASSFGELRLFKTNESDVFLFPWNSGAFNDNFEHNVNTNYGIAFDFSSQLNNQHELGFGGETIYTKAEFDLGQPSFEPFVYGNEFCYVKGLAPLLGCNPATDGTPVLPTFPEATGLTTDPLHRSNLWIKDRWVPTDRLNVVAGLRWDQEILNIPGNASAFNYGFSTDTLGRVVQVAGPTISTDVTKPSQVSPRLAISYQANSRNVFRATYGKNIQFTPFSNIEFLAKVDPALASCTIASGCFAPLPGFGTTNNITNLYQQIIGDYNTGFFTQYTPVRPERATNLDASWEHDFGSGLELKITPYHRRGYDYVVSSTPLLFTLPDGTPIFGAPREENAGLNKSTGVEFSLQRIVRTGWGGFVNVTYDNTLANYNSDFFPSVNNAAVALNHFFHVSYLAPITATANLTYDSRKGLHAAATIPYSSGYRYGVGKKTFLFLPVGPGGATVPVQVLNTDLAASALNLNANTSAYYFTDPVDPGTILNPHITGSRGTADGDDPGTLRGPQRMFLNLSVSHDVGNGPNNTLIGLRVTNVFGNYTNAVVGGNSRYRNNGLGGYSPTSGAKSTLPQPYLFARSPFPFESEPIGPARLFTLYFSAKY